MQSERIWCKYYAMHSKVEFVIMFPKMILITGGTGFIGKALTNHLVRTGRQVRTLLKPGSISPKLPQGVSVEAAICSLFDEKGIRAAMKDVDIVFHLAGTERQGSKSDLTGVDIAGVRILANVASDNRVKKFFFLSHLGADRASAFPVLKAKAITEQIIKDSGVNYTIYRTAVVFGENDQFSTSILKLLRRSPRIFLMPGNGSSLVQPIYIDDLIAVLLWSLEEKQPRNSIFSIGGIEHISFSEVVAMIMNTVEIRRFIVSLSPAYLRILAVWFEHNSKNFPISSYWLDYLASDRTCALDSIPRLTGIMPARFSQNIEFLKKVV